MLVKLQNFIEELLRDMCHSRLYKNMIYRFFVDKLVFIFVNLKLTRQG